MGSLVPGATYIYEKANGVTYARISGDPPASRVEIGRDYGAADTFLGMPVAQVAELIAMKQAADTNLALQDALERAIVIYTLSKE